MSGMQILVVEDQTAIARNIAEYFEPRGHVLDFATDGSQGLSLALSNPYDLVVLDIMLPGMDGFEVCRRIRAESNRHIPVLMLTAMDSLDDKSRGFGDGADDYLTKPFALKELELRCMALGRRHRLQSDHVINLGPLSIDRTRRQVFRQGQEIRLKQVGYKILEVLAESYPRVVPRSELMQKIWHDEPTESDALRSHIYQLRAAVDKPFDRALIKTVHGVGFSLDIPDPDVA